MGAPQWASLSIVANSSSGAAANTTFSSSGMASNATFSGVCLVLFLDRMYVAVVASSGVLSAGALAGVVIGCVSFVALLLWCTKACSSKADISSASIAKPPRQVQSVLSAHFFSEHELSWQAGQILTQPDIGARVEVTEPCQFDKLTIEPGTTGRNCC